MIDCDDRTMTSALGLFVVFVRMNPGLDPADPIILRAFRAYVEDAERFDGLEGHEDAH